MIPLFTADQVRKADNYAISKLKIQGTVLMENASRSIFNTIREIYPELSENKPVGIVAGGGNNGGDGFAVARHFINYGFKVIVISIPKKSDLRGDALTNYLILKNLTGIVKDSSIVHFKELKDLSGLSKCQLIIDAVLGTGAKGKLKEPLSSVIQKLNTFEAIKVAIDVPTGLDLSNARGDIVFNADLTVTLGELKNGLFYLDGWANSGVIEKGYIGIGSEYFDSLTVDTYLVEPEDALFGFPEKKINSHKYSAGKVLTIAGSGDFPGAAFFTANSVLKSGAGASILAFPESMKFTGYNKLDAATLLTYQDENKQFLSPENIGELKEKIEWADVIAIGPGLGRKTETFEAVREIINSYPEKIMVVDADAVIALGEKSYLKLDLRNVVFTPHHKEFADLLGISLEELVPDLMGKAKEFVKKTSSFLVLKGAPTLIFNPDGEVFINSTGNPGMSKFGMGDVLTGIIGGFLAQNEDIESAVISAVYLHSLSADLLLQDKTEFGFTASDVMNNLPASFKFLRDTFV